MHGVNAQQRSVNTFVGGKGNGIGLLEPMLHPTARYPQRLGYIVHLHSLIIAQQRRAVLRRQALQRSLPVPRFIRLHAVRLLSHV